VATPGHANYGKYLSANELTDLVGAEAHRITAVQEWLQSHGVNSATLVGNNDYLRVPLTVSQLRSLFAVENVVTLSHPQSTATLIRSLDPITIPSHVAPHIVTLEGLGHPPLLPDRSTSKRRNGNGNGAASTTTYAAPAPSNTQDPCHSFNTSCGSCVSQSGCGWCDSTQQCLSGDSFNPTDANAPNCDSWQYKNAADPNAPPVCLAPPVVLGSESYLHRINVFVQPLCPDGSHPQEPNTPCQNHPSMIKGFALQLRSKSHLQTVLHQRQALLNHSFVDLCFCEGDGNGEDPCQMLCQVSISEVENYRTAIPFVQMLYVDGTRSLWGRGVPVIATEAVTPALIKDFYGMPSNALGTNSHNSQGVGEFSLQSFDPADLHTFQELFERPVQAATPIGVNNPASPGGEGTLDIQYIMAVSPGVASSYWGTQGQGWILEYFAQLAGRERPPLVNSISWGAAETEEPPSYMQRANEEAMKLALRGVSIIVSSGDNGVGGNLQAGGCAPFVPSFPANLPYVTTLGATMLTRSSTSVSTHSTMLGEFPLPHPQYGSTLGERVCQVEEGALIESGGGFSSVFNRPSWQDAAVSAFLATPNAAPPADLLLFNQSGRAFPDLATLGHAYVIYQSSLQSVDGTSASAPVFAAMVAQWNEMLLNNGLPPLGFLNPLLYQLAASHPAAFTDITVGSNNCGEGNYCCPHGFNAVPGWDAASGLGSPQFQALEAAIFALKQQAAKA
jgi:subtilase family serine protease